MKETPLPYNQCRPSQKSTDNVVLLRQELEIHKGELLENLHFASLEKSFIEERIYKEVKFEQSKNTDAACEFIDERLTPFYPWIYPWSDQRGYSEVIGYQDGPDSEVQQG